MDHSKLHKAGRGAAAKNASENRQRRRSLLQRKKRDDLARKQRDLEPLREKDSQGNAKQIQNDIRDRLSKWQQARAAKKKREKAAAKPVFKTGKICRTESALPITKPQKDTKKKIAPEPPKSEKVVKTRSGRTARYVASRIDCQPPKSMVNKKKDKKESKSDKSTKSIKENHKNITNQVECEPPATAEVKMVQSPPSLQKDTRELEPKVCQPQSTDEDLPLDSLEMDAPPTSAGLSESFAPTNFQFKPPKGLHKFPFFPDSLLASTSTILPTIADRGPTGFLSSTPYQPDSTTGTQQIQPPLPLALPCSSESSDDNEAKKKEGKSKEADNVEQDKEPEKEEDAEKTEKVLHFKSLVISETNKLTSKCKEWEEIKEKHEEELSEENLGKILSVIGQAQLVMAERFTQFGGLIEKCEHPTPDHNPVMPSDLEGFWDMIYFQVEDVLKKFKDLSDLKENKWEKAAEKKVVKRKRAAKRRSVKGSSALRRAAKKRIQAAKAAMKEKNLLLDEDDNVLKEETQADVEQNPKGGRKTVRLMQDEEEDAAMEDQPFREACRITRSGKRTPRRAQENTFSSDLATTATSADSQDETIVRRSKRKSARKNVSFVTPSKKRKTNFEDSSSGGRMTPSSGQPRKRVMRKTPLPSMRPDSVMTPGNMTPGNTDNMQCSPTLNRSGNTESPSPAVEHEPEYGTMKGLKLNFDDVESDEEKDTETGGIDEIYLSRTGINLLDEDSPSSPVFPGVNAIVSTESPGLATIQSPQSPVIKTPLSSFSKSSTTVAQTTSAVPAKSPGRVLRNARKSFHHPMSPFMKKSVDSPLDSSTDLMSFSPVEIRKVSDNAHNEVGTVTKFAAISVPKKIKERLGTDLVFSPVRRSARIASHHSSDESVQELHDTLDDCAKSGLDFGYLPNKV